MEKNLLSAEKIVKKIIRNVFRDSKLDYTVQIAISSIEPNKVKYSALISSPSRNVQDLSYKFDSFKELEQALNVSLKELNYADVEKTSAISRINVYKNKIKELEEYCNQIDKLGLDEDGFLNTEEAIDDTVQE